MTEIAAVVPTSENKKSKIIDDFGNKNRILLPKPGPGDTHSQAKVSQNIEGTERAVIQGLYGSTTKGKGSRSLLSVSVYY